MSGGRYWKKEEIDFILALNEKGVHHYDIAAEFSTKFGYTRSRDSIRNQLSRRGVELAPFPKTPSASLISPHRANSGPVFKLTQSKLESFVRHDADIKQMFRRAGLKRGGIFKLVVQPDTHVPYHDRSALSAFNKFLDWYKPHGLINIGDFWEAESVSHWPARGPAPRRLAPEILSCRKELDETEAAAGKQCRFKRFFIGNHEAWLDQYLVAKIPEALDGLEELGVNLSVKKLLQLKERGYKTIPENEALRIGEAHFIHGYYTNKYHAQKHLDVWRCNIYYGHTHDVQSATNVSIYGLHQAQSLGCLRDLNARFLKGKPNNWAHAFGIFEFRYDGAYTVTVPIMIEGRFSYAGVLFDGKAAG